MSDSSNTSDKYYSSFQSSLMYIADAFSRLEIWHFIILCVIFLLLLFYGLFISTQDKKYIDHASKYLCVLVLVLALCGTFSNFQKSLDNPCQKDKRNALLSWQVNDKIDSITSFIYGTFLLYASFTVTYVQYFLVFYIIYVLMRCHILYKYRPILKDMSPSIYLILFSVFVLWTIGLLLILLIRKQNKLLNWAVDRSPWFFLYALLFLVYLPYACETFLVWFDIVLVKFVLPFFNHSTLFSHILLNRENAVMHGKVLLAMLLIAFFYGLFFIKPYSFSQFCKNKDDPKVVEEYNTYRLKFSTGLFIISMLIIIMYSLSIGAMILV